MVPLCPKSNVWPGRDSRACQLMHAALPMLATLAVLGAIFHAFPALCPCEPRRSRGEMHGVPCGAPSTTGLLPASTSQPPPACIRFVRIYYTGICISDEVKTVLTFANVQLPRKRKLNTPGQPRSQTLLLLPRRAAARAAGEYRSLYPCLHPCPHARVEIRGRTGSGRRPPKPHTNLIHMRAAATAAACCCYCYCCCAAAAEVNLVQAVVGTAAVLLLALVE